MKANLIPIRIRNREAPATRIFGYRLNERCSSGAQCRGGRFNIGNFKCWHCTAFTLSASNVGDGERHAIDIVFYPPLSGRTFVFQSKFHSEHSLIEISCLNDVGDVVVQKSNSGNSETHSAVPV